VEINVWVRTFFKNGIGKVLLIDVWIISRILVAGDQEKNGQDHGKHSGHRIYFYFNTFFPSTIESAFYFPK
jgi:hypothetical protein